MVADFSISSVALFFIYYLSTCLAHTVDSTSLNFSDTELHHSRLDSDSLTTSNGSQCGNRPWLMESDCECANSIDGIIYCDSSKDVFIKSQYCMSLYDDLGEEVVGRCPYTYLKFNDPSIANIGLYYKAPNETNELEYALCDGLNRRGLFCGKCKEGYGYPMYPNFIECVECHPKDYIWNWVLFTVVSFGPLTLFLIVVICLRINAASVPMNTFILISQVITQPPFARGFINTINDSFLPNSAKVFMRFLHSLYGIWNLDFFVAMIPPFCLPRQNILSVITLSYLIALYPLVLLVLLYVFIELYSKDFRILVWLWKPFHSCYIRFRRQWDIRASIIDAFATFLLLSYVKLLFVSFDVLAPTKLLSKNGSVVELVSYFDASVVISPKPGVVLIIVGIALLLLLFTFLPAVLLLLYPFSFCQKCLTCTRMHFQFLHFLMNSFNGCYKDRTEGALDCRSFAAIFLFVRILVSVEYAVLYFNYYTSVMVTFTALAVAIAIVQPYGKQNLFFNRFDPLMIFFLIIWLVSYKDIRMAAGKHLSHQRMSVALCFISLFLPLILVTLYLLKKTALGKWHRHVRNHAPSSFEDSLEQRPHNPYVPQLGYVSAESVLH